MKEIRPATWATLVVMGLLIFIPALFVDMDDYDAIPDNDERFQHSTPPNPDGADPQPPQVPIPDPQPKPGGNQGNAEPDKESAKEPAESME